MSSVAKGNATRIKRGAANARKPRPVVKRTRKTRAQRGPSWFAKLLVRLHITPALIRKATTVALVGCACVATLMVANLAGVPRALKSVAAHQLAKAGLVVRH
ncbi:MAG: hypothetical protein KGQ42_04925, partial [Alphaproteobacteria bacterium]|nr:hypothetical protein [Alphaproteobacteria bacterium]